MKLDEALHAARQGSKVSCEGVGPWYLVWTPGNQDRAGYFIWRYGIAATMFHEDQWKNAKNWEIVQ